MATQTEPLIGRADEIARIEHALEQLSARAPGFVEMSGEAGIGKTRLLRELCARAEQRDYLVLEGQAAEFERDVPFAPIVDALDAYLASLDEDDAKLPRGELREELAAIFPSLRNGGEHPTATVQDERYRAYRAVRELLKRLAAARPLVVALDDLQWADQASAELIAALLQKPPQAPMLIAIARRPGTASSRLEVAAGAAADIDGVQRMRLAPLSEREAGELLGDRVHKAMLEALYEAAGGNPFYLEQLARAWAPGVAGGEPGARGSRDELGVPHAVSAALAVEIEALGQPERDVLDAAAVAGERFSPELVAAIAGIDEFAALVAIDELIRHELVRPTPLPRRFAFRHPLVWRAVYSGTKAGWRIGAHARAADALEREGAAAVERAHHVEQAARRGDERAIAVLRQAGKEAAARTPEVAARWFRAALRLLPEDGAGEAQAVELLVSLASALRGSGDLSECRATLVRALELVPGDDVAARVRLESNCAAVEQWVGRPEDAHRRLERALRELGDERQDSEEAAILKVELAVEALARQDFEQARAVGCQALETAQALGARPLVASAAAARCLTEGLAGRVEEARAHRERAAAELAALEDAQLADRLETFYYLAWGESWIEAIDEALEHADRGLAISRATGQGRLIVPLTLAKAFPLEMRGRLAEAIELCEASVEAARASANPQYVFWALWELGWACGMAGDPRAIGFTRESEKASRGLARNPLGWVQPGATYGWLLINDGEVENGIAVGLEAVGGPDAPRAPLAERPTAWVLLAAAERLRGRLDVAEEYVVRCERLAAQFDLDVPKAIAAQARAAQLLATDAPAEALEVAAAGRKAAATLRLLLDEAQLRAFEGRALAALGQREKAVKALREAEAAFASFPAARERDTVRRELRKLGARVEPRGTAVPGEAGLAALSAREREVAELVTARLTNPQIAERLFLSLKTVETHMRNIFAKLGISSRVELARVVEREGRER